MNYTVWGIVQNGENELILHHNRKNSCTSSARTVLFP